MKGTKLERYGSAIIRKTILYLIASSLQLGQQNFAQWFSVCCVHRTFAHSLNCVFVINKFIVHLLCLQQRIIYI